MTFMWPFLPHPCPRMKPFGHTCSTYAQSWPIHFHARPSQKRSAGKSKRQLWLLCSQSCISTGTLHAIIFEDKEHGGLTIPAYFIDQCSNQLHFFIGHLKPQDDVGKFILIHTSKLQLLLGLSKPFFRTPFNSVSKITAPIWLLLIWKNTLQLRITMDVEDHWVLHASREGNQFLMDHAHYLNFSPAAIKQINQCRLYLQVLT